MKSFNNENSNNSKEEGITSKLKFKGSLLGTVFRISLVCLISLLSLSTFYPFLINYLAEWCIKNTTYNGKYLKFKEKPSPNYTYMEILNFAFCLMLGYSLIFTYAFRISFFIFIIVFSVYNYYFIKLLIGNIIIEEDCR